MSILVCCQCGNEQRVDDDTAGPRVPVNWSVIWKPDGRGRYFCPFCWPVWRAEAEPKRRGAEREGA